MTLPFHSDTMSTDEASSHLAESGVTINSDSEQYSAGEEASTEPESSSSSPPIILYQPPTIWGLFRGAAINLLLPFVNGMMLGFGELFAHEAAFRLGWGGTKVSRAITPRLQHHCMMMPSGSTRLLKEYVDEQSLTRLTSRYFLFQGGQHIPSVQALRLGINLRNLVRNFRTSRA